MKKNGIIGGLVFLLSTAAVVSGLAAQSAGDEKVSAGGFSVLTYNVAGLPEGISGSHPLVNTSKISPKLNAFDIVLVQEDFTYHRKLRSKAEHPYISGPGRGGSLGDGLARFSRFPFSEVEHIDWEECYGTMGYANDCLTPKGFSFATHEVAPGVFIDIYNLHMDAGGSKGDIEARDAGMDQLIAWMAERSAGRAVIIGGDWNLNARRDRDMEVLDRILTKQNLKDSCRALNCGEERIDRILFRGDDRIRIEAVEYKVEVQRFEKKRRIQLSDHEAVSTVFGWEYIQ